MPIVEYTQRDGVKRMSYLPNATGYPEEGIPVDIYDDLCELYQDAPAGFVNILWEHLWKRGLRIPEHFQAPDVHKRTQAAYRQAVKWDAMRIVNIAKEAANEHQP